MSLENTLEGGGSMQLRHYLALRRKGVERAEAAHQVGMSLTEAGMWDADDARGELGWVGKPSRARARASAPAPARETGSPTEEGTTMEGVTRVTMKAGDGPEVDITDALEQRMNEGREIVDPDLPSAEMLRAYVSRIERVQEEIDGLNTDKSDIFAEAKSQGFDTKALKLVIKRRKDGEDVTNQMDALIATYERALSPQFALGLDG